MGEGDDNKHSRATQRFDREALALLTREAGGQPADGVPTAEAADPISSSRTATLDDPMTMALLAEAARSSQTIEVDPAVIEAAIADAEANDPDTAGRRREPTHPHTLRRTR
jgi:hypothetical protein